MGKLIAVEGLDGAGKRTLTNALRKELAARGARVTALAFPRYERDVHADLAREALHGRLGDLADSVHGMAVLFALDRLGARQTLAKNLADNDVLLVDRYVASNAAYGAARLHQDANGEFVSWLIELELGRFELVAPQLQLLLRVPVELAANRTVVRESTELDRGRDSFESDSELQSRCAVVYDQLAEDGWLAPWLPVHYQDGILAADLADRVLA